MNPIFKFLDRSQWPVGVTLCLMIGALFLLPSRVRQEVVRNYSHPLVIETSKTSPPRLAFHESLDRLSSSDASANAEPPGLQHFNLNEILARSTHFHGVQAIRSKKVVLQTMEFPRTVVAAPEQIPSVPDRSWVEALPSKLRQRVEVATQHGASLDQDWSLPSFGQMVQAKIKEINAQTQAPSSPSKVFVAARTPSGTWQTPEQSKEGIGVSVNPSALHSENIASTGVEGFNQEPSVGLMSQPPGFVVKGSLSVDSESAVGTGRHFEVHWFDDGIAKETGKVDLNPKDVTYQIAIPALTGTVMVSLLDESGTEIGSGQHRVGVSDSKETLQNAPIQVKPRSRVTQYSQNVYDTELPASMMKISRAHQNPRPEVLVSAFGDTVQSDDDGVVRVDGIAEGSWTFLRSRKKGFYPSLHLAQAGDEKVMPLFPEKMMKALIQIVRDNKGGSGLGGQSGAIIWGQMTKGQMGMAGAHVQIEDLPEAEAVYFNDLLIPDDKAKVTGRNGYFAFVDLPRGFYSLRALQGEKQLGISNVEVDEETVSPVQIETQALLENVPVKVFDAFTGSAQIANVEFQLLPESVEITGFAQISLPQDGALSIVKVQPADRMYVPTVQVFSSTQDHLHLPLVRQDWLQSLKTTMKVSDVPEAGTLIGFVPSSDYEIELPHLEQGAQVTTLYFDAEGNLSPKGVAGGGFVVMNCPLGSQTVSVLPKSANVLHSRVIPVDAGTLNVLKFDF